MEPHVTGLLKEIASREDLHSSFQTKSVENPEPNSFHGVLKFIVIEDGRKRVPLVLKSSHKDQLTRAAQKTNQKFKNEVTFYRDIVEQIGKFSLVPRVPKYYGSCLEELKEVIVLEDLRSSAFVSIPFARRLDSKHLMVVAAALAALHQAALQWKYHQPSCFSKVTSELRETLFVSHEHPESKKIAESIFKRALNVATQVAHEEFDHHVSEYMKCMTKLDNLQRWVTPTKEDQLLTLIHGDVYTNNLLFKYNEEGEPVEVALIDWQMTRLGSPAMDLTQCLLSSGDFEALNEPDPFVEMYVKSSGLQFQRQSLDFFKWGRPGLLLTLCITAYISEIERKPITEKLQETLNNTEIEEACDLDQKRHVTKILQAAELLGVFAPC